MRTSRIARETAKFLSAVSPRSTRSHKIAVSNREYDDARYDRAISSPSPALSDGSEATPLPSVASSTRKRKRRETVTVQVKEEPASPTTSRTGSGAPSSTKPKKARRQPVKKVVGRSGEVVKVEPPANWERFYSLTREMRSQWPAAVDTMGCESLAEEHRSPRDQRFQTLISLMLSSQTKDTVTAVAIKNLQEGLSGGLTLESILAVQPETLNGLIAKVGFHNNKTKYIKAAAEILRCRYDSDIPSTIEGLVSLPGVGPKMAYLCMSAAWGRDEGIGVDVHVHRITNLWGWHKTKEPEQTRAALESWLPREKWHDINNLLVGFGQTWCPPVGRKCEQCKLSEEGLCPSAVVSKSSKMMVKKEHVVVKDERHGVSVGRHEVLESEVPTVKDEPLEPHNPIPMNAEVQDIEDIGRLGRRSRRLER